MDAATLAARNAARALAHRERKARVNECDKCAAVADPIPRRPLPHSDK